jgi:hypothetical protein
MKRQINSDLYPLAAGEQFSFVLASSLVSDGTDVAMDGTATGANDRDVWRPGKSGLADDYDYVM